MQYLNFWSCHPKHTKTSIPYNLARRIGTIVCDQSQREKRLSELHTSLKIRNYPDTVISEGIKKAKSIPRHTLLITNTKEEKEVHTFQLSIPIKQRCLEEKLYSQTEKGFDKEFATYINKNWKRFLDDCFILWSKGAEHLKRFHSVLNKLHPH